MRHRYSLLFSLLLTAPALPGLAQTTAITITRDDMPNVNDSLRVSQALQLTGPALSLNGPGQTWNYAGLRPAVQQVNQFQSVTSTSPLLALAFGPFGGVNRATVAAHYNLSAVLGPLGLPGADAYAFFNESAADYRQVGFGVPVPVVTPPIVLPVFYQSQQLQDVVYRFPLTYQQHDSSNSEFTAELTGTAYLHDKQKRVNRADAWGTLITPFGTFATLRVVSTVYAHDSLALSGAPGTALARPVSREYKWLGKNQGIPLLQVNTQLVSGQEIVSSITYRDIYRRLVVLATTASLPAAAVAAYPNPLPGTAALRLTLPAAGPVTLTATDLAGRLLFRQTLTAAGREAVVPAEAFGAFRGVALLRVQTAAGVAVRRVVRE